jgi:hypothetical protein
MKIIKAVGIDAAFANMGFALVEIIIQHGHPPIVKCLGLTLVSTTVTEDRKAVRKSSTELRRAKELHTALQAQCQGVQIAFAEVPSGSQSAAAARALGIAVGVLSSCPVPIIEVSPMEVKFAVLPNKKIKVTKDYIIQWAVKLWPTANWLRARDAHIIKDNEHLADALATVMAGIATPEFQRLIAIHGISSTNYVGPTSDLPALDRIPLGTLPVVICPDQRAPRKVIVDIGGPNRRERRSLC